MQDQKKSILNHLHIWVFAQRDIGRLTRLSQFGVLCEAPVLFKQSRAFAAQGRDGLAAKRSEARRAQAPALLHSLDFPLNEEHRLSGFLAAIDRSITLIERLRSSNR
jgi:hypothetical protein